MRVNDRNSGFQDERGSGRDRASNRAAFRRSRRVGDRLRAKVLAVEGPDMVRIRADGLELLAKSASRPAPGCILEFEVLALEPEILLKELPVASQPDREAPRLLGRFAAARDALETALGGLALPAFGELPLELMRRGRLFRDLIADGPAEKLWREARRLAGELDALLAGRGGWRFGYAPWLLPAARSHELLWRRLPAAGKSGQGRRGLVWEILCAFTLAGPGFVRLHILYEKPRAGVRLALERPRMAGAVAPLLRDLRLGAVALRTDLLGVGPAPPEHNLLSPLLQTARRSFTGLSLQV